MTLVIPLLGFFGACVRGLTGFGQAIVVLVLWSLLNACGLDIGSLKLVVLCDTFASLPCAIPFMVLTDVCNTGKIGIIVPVALFMNVSSPVGAFLIKHLDRHILMITLAAVLLAAVIIQNLLPCVLNYFKNGQQQDQEIELQAVGSEISQDITINDGDQILSDQLQIIKSDDSEVSIHINSDEIELNNVNNKQICQASEDLEKDSNLKINNQDEKYDNDKSEESSSQLADEESEEINLLDNQYKSYQLTKNRTILNKNQEQKQTLQTLVQNVWKDTQNVMFLCYKISYHIFFGNFTFQRKLSNQTIQLNFDFVNLDSPSQFFFKKIQLNEKLIISASLGWLNGIKYMIFFPLCAGLLGSMLGIPGPPLMIMSQILNMPKIEIRSTQAALSFFNPRIIFYIIFGLFRIDEMHVYVLYTIFTMFGLLVGNWMAEKISQELFMKCLTLLVIASALTLLCQALGVLPHKA